MYSPSFTSSRDSRMVVVLMAIDVNFALLSIAGYGFFNNFDPMSLFLFHPSLILLALLFPFALYPAELYRIKRKWLSPATAFRVFSAVSITIVLYGLSHYILCRKEPILPLFYVLSVGMTAEVILVRAMAAQTRGTWSHKTALIIGAGWSGRLVVDTILKEPRLNMEIAGTIDDNVRKRNAVYRGVKVLGNRDYLEKAVNEHGVKIIILAISYIQNAEMIKTLLSLKMRSVEIIEMPRFYERVTGQIPIKHVEDSWFLYSGGFEILHSPVRQKIKRVLDIAASLTGFLLSLPLMAVIALIIKIDSKGPVFFPQERIGQNEGTFNLIKFRTMHADAEKKSGPVWANPHDYRVTRVGRMLRMTRLDEIPQFINVLKGDMSFIGPRPERPYFVDRLKKNIPYYSLRFTVKPGLSGWAQVNYQCSSSANDAIDKLQYDLYYIKNMSAWLDTVIFFKTFQEVLFARGF